MRPYAIEPKLGVDGNVVREPVPEKSGDDKVLAKVHSPFQPSGGIKVLTGNIGNAIIKVSAVKPERHVIEAPAKVFNDQSELQAAFKAGDLTGDFIAVVRYQGPKANGMPELHKLMTVLGILQDRGQRVALVTDGRLSGASGKVPSAIHVTPEALDGGAIGKIRNGDIVRLDAMNGTLEVLINDALLAERSEPRPDLSGNEHGMGRELFRAFRQIAGRADEGASVF